MPPRYLAELFLLAMIWGGSFLFMRITVPEFGPLVVVAMRMLLSAFVLLPLLWLPQFNRQQKLPPQLRQFAPKLVLIAIISSIVPFVSLAYALAEMPSGYASLINATAPMFTALIGLFWLGKRLDSICRWGILIGFIGVVVLASGHDDQNVDAQLYAIVLGLVATLFYGISGNYINRYMDGVSPWVIAAGGQAYAALLTMPLLYLFWPENSPSLEAWLALIALGTISTGGAFAIFFRLLSMFGAVQANSVTYLIPLFGLLWGSLILDEVITPIMVIGGVIIVIGTILVNWRAAHKKTT